MRLAVVGWGGDSGVGRELIEAIRHLPVEAAYILPNNDKPTRKELITVPHYLAVGRGSVSEMKKFIDDHKIDTVLTWEIPGCWEFPRVWKEKKVRWVHVVHWDWFAADQMAAWRGAAVLVAPNRMCRDELAKNYGLASVYLPVPVDTDRFAFKLRAKADHFLSVYAHGGPFDRRSLGEILEAWKKMAAAPKLTILAQKNPPEVVGHDVPKNVEILVGNAPEPKDLYEIGDVAVQMSRYEGVGISFLEAQARGMPVMAIDAPPMNEIAPDLPVARKSTETISLLGKAVYSHVPSVESIVKVVESVKGKDIADLSRKVRLRVEQLYSWTTLKGRWIEVLAGGAP